MLNGSSLETLAGAAAWAWHALDEPMTVEELTALIAEAHEVDAGSIRDEMSRLWEDLDRRGLLTAAA